MKERIEEESMMRMSFGNASTCKWDDHQGSKWNGMKQENAHMRQTGMEPAATRDGCGTARQLGGSKQCMRHPTLATDDMAFPVPPHRTQFSTQLPRPPHAHSVCARSVCKCSSKTGGMPRFLSPAPDTQHHPT